MSNHQTYKGTVQSVHPSRPVIDEVTGKESILYSFALKGVDGWFRCGAVRPDIKPGDAIQFDASANKRVAMSTLARIPTYSTDPNPVKESNVPAPTTETVSLDVQLKRAIAAKNKAAYVSLDAVNAAQAEIDRVVSLMQAG